MVNAGGMITALVLLLTLLLIQVRMLDFSSFKCEGNYYFPDPMLPQLSEVYFQEFAFQERTEMWSCHWHGGVTPLPTLGHLILTLLTPGELGQREEFLCHQPQHRIWTFYYNSGLTLAVKQQFAILCEAWSVGSL